MTIRPLASPLYPPQAAALALGGGLLYAPLVFFPVSLIPYGLHWSAMTVIAFAASVLLADFASDRATMPTPRPLVLRAYRRLLVWSFALFLAPYLVWRLGALALMSIGVMSPL